MTRFHTEGHREQPYDMAVLSRGSNRTHCSIHLNAAHASSLLSPNSSWSAASDHLSDHLLLPAVSVHLNLLPHASVAVLQRARRHHQHPTG